MLPKNLQNLIRELRRLPGVGPKSAEKLAMHLLRSHRSNVNELADALRNLKEGIVLCQTCWNVSESSPCKICDNTARNANMICVVEEVMDALAIERTHEFKGLYHVLHGRISPLNNMSPQDVKIVELLRRVESMEDKSKIEIILAMNPDMEGEATSMYISRMLKPTGVKITRIARGLPTGAHVEYADDITLTRALEGRSDF